MDRREWPSRANYGVGFDACDPLGSVLEWSRGPARILRRRCRSEGIDRSPYDDARELRSADGVRERSRPQPIKSHFTINNAECRRFRHECSLPTAEIGDYVMSHDRAKYQDSYQPGKSKIYRKSPTRPLLVTTLSNTKLDDSRLPKVEELLEKIDYEMKDVPVAKTPLKSILNNTIPKSPPQGILKKPKNKSYQDSKVSLEGRRRQRAVSESDNFYCNFHIGSPIPGYDTLGNSRCKSPDYSQSRLGNTRCRSPDYKSRCPAKEQMPSAEDAMHLLRT
ncbi:putative epoxide hydrolase, partial [Operophtera brumata]